MPLPLDQLVLGLDGYVLYWGLAALALGVAYLVLPSGGDIEVDDAWDRGDGGADGD